MLLSPARYFSCKHKGSKSVSSSSHLTASSDSRSIASFDSQCSTASSSSQIQTTPTEYTATSSPNATGYVDSSQYSCESDSDLDFADTTPCSSLEGGSDTWIQSPSSWVSELPHDCNCKSRSTCPDFLQHHFTYLQTHERQRLPASLLTAYRVSADEYAMARDALALPAAKLERAKAEYDWVVGRQTDGTRLWPPRLLKQRTAARRKVVAAEEEWDLANKKRWERAQLLMDVGRF